jgi:hypothetical protein
MPIDIGLYQRCLQTRDARTFGVKTATLAVGVAIAVVFMAVGLDAAAKDGPSAMPGEDVASFGPSAFVAPPTAEIVQLLLAWKAGVPADFDPSGLFSRGDFLYAVGPLRQPSIHFFHRDASSGLLSYAGSTVVAELQCHSTADCLVGGRLYFLLTRWVNDGVDNRLAWYDLDAKTGKPERNGVSPMLIWTDRPGHTESAGWGGMLVPSGDQKNLYVTTDRVILRFKIEADGTPVPAGQLAEKGVGQYIFAAPDGKWLYTMTHNPFPAIACIQCKPSGEIGLKNLVKLDPKWGVRNAQVQTEFSMFMSPDGQWLYAADWNVGGDDVDKGDVQTTNSYLAVFQRDPASGALKLTDAGCGNDSTRPDHMLANSRALRLVFSPDGASGFVSTASGSLLRSFARNTRTGRIGTIAEFPQWDTRRLETRCLWLDGEKGLLYGASGKPFGPAAHNVGAETHAMWVAKVGKGREPPRPVIVPVLTGSQAASGPAAAADWPHWRGPSADLTSPLRGIRKDWTGGLRKVWEVRGLSPGAHTWSQPTIQGNRLVVSGRHGFLDRWFCFDADHGGPPLWVAEMEGGEAGHFDWGSGSHAAAAIDGDKVFVANLLGIAAGISMSDGKVLWKKLIAGGMYTGAPLVYDNLVICAGGNNYWHGFPAIAYRKDTGVVAWTYGQRCHSNSAPLLAKIDGRDQVVHIETSRLFGIDPQTGAELWTFSTPDMLKTNPEGGPIATPAVAGNIVYPAWSECPTVQVDGRSVKELWTRFSGGKPKVSSASGSSLSDAAVIDGYMYHFTGSPPSYANAPRGGLACTEFKTGKVQWTENLGNGSLLVVDNCLLCLTYAGDLLLVKPAPSKYTKLAEIKGFVKRDLWISRQAAKLNEPEEDNSPYGETDYAPCWASPSVARGKLYVHYSDRLACYDLMSP